MLIDMIHDNHGEPPFKTRYRAAATLRALGFEAVVIPDALAAIPAAQEGAEHGNAALRNPRELAEAVDARVKDIQEQGMRVFFYGDALLLPANLVAERPGDFLCEDKSGRLCPGKPPVYAAMKEQAGGLFDRWPEAAGLIMRTGEVYPEATPHMTGSALHAGNCPICRELSSQERLVRFITAMHEAVIVRHNKIYVHRTWQPGPTPGTGGGQSLHDDPEMYREISRRVPESPDLWFSFKFTRGDFQNEQRINPCLLADERPKWIEFQGEREFEGKGAFPNYQGGVWRDFFAELRRQGTASEVMPIEEMKRRFGMWGWSRGGGWGGPYVQREEWIDANVTALAELYRNPEADAAEIATAWVGRTLGIAESSPPAPALTELLTISSRTVRGILYVTALGERTTPWLRDDLLDVDAIFSAARKITDAGLLTEAIAEKHEALEGVDRMRKLMEIAAAELPSTAQVRELSTTLAYFESFSGTVVALFIGFARYCQWVSGGKSDAELAKTARQLLETAQAQWQIHTQRHALLPGVASVFHEMGLWERTNACLAELR